MGCAISSGTDRLSNIRVFDVANIDDGGQERSAGKIEVTEVELILHYPGRQTIRWPLKSLRRYGYNDHLFSFESGRRCPTGHGIYAFRCVNAEMLFHQLQQAIVRAGEERAARTADPGPRRQDHYRQTDWSSIGSVLQQQRFARIGQEERLDDRFADYISCYPHISPSWRTYVNQHIANHHAKHLNGTVPQDAARQPCSEGGVQYADLDLPVFCDAVDIEDYDEEADVFQSPEIVSDPSFRSTYVNVPISMGNAVPLFTRESRTCLTSNGVVPTTLTSSRTAKVTYAQLDLDAPGPSPQGASPGSAKIDCTSRDKCETYATIDFQRTRALSTKASESEDQGFRKTRHNSNIEMLTRN